MKIIIASIVLILGIIMGWYILGGTPRERQEEKPNTKEKCMSQNGKPIFVGYSGSWNCEF